MKCTSSTRQIRHRLIMELQPMMLLKLQLISVQQLDRVEVLSIYFCIYRLQAKATIITVLYDYDVANPLNL